MQTLVIASKKVCAIWWVQMMCIVTATLLFIFAVNAGLDIMRGQVADTVTARGGTLNELVSDGGEVLGIVRDEKWIGGDNEAVVRSVDGRIFTCYEIYDWGCVDTH